MMHRIVKEISILGYFVFLFVFIVGVFSDNPQNYMVIASSHHSSNLLLSVSQTLGSIFFFMIGKFSYYMIFFFFPIVLGLLFDKIIFYTMACRIGCIILNLVILSGIFSPSSEWVESGIIGSFFNDLCNSFLLHIFTSLLLLVLIFYQFYLLVVEIVSLSEQAAWLKSFFMKKPHTSQRKVLSEHFDNIGSSYSDLPHSGESGSNILLLESVVDALSSQEADNTEKILEYLSYLKPNFDVIQDVLPLKLRDQFGKLLQKYIHHLYQMEKLGSPVSLTNLGYLELSPYLKHPLSSNQYINQGELYASLQDIDKLGEMTEYPTHQVETTEGDLFEDIHDITSIYLTEQFNIQERLGDVFDSFEAPLSLASYHENRISHPIPEAISYAQEIFHQKREKEPYYSEHSDHSFQSLESLNNSRPQNREIMIPKTGGLSYINPLKALSVEFSERIDTNINQALTTVPQEESGVIAFTEASEVYTFPHQIEKALDQSLEDHSMVDIEDLDLGTQQNHIVENTIYADFQDTPEEPVEATEAYDELNINNEFELPSVTLLEKGIALDSYLQEDKELVGEQIIEILKEFNIQAELDKVIVGPVVTRYEIKPPKGLKVSRIIELDNNIALGLASKDRLRIEAPVFGKSVVGIEVPNLIRETVKFRDILESFNKHYATDDFSIPFLMGKTLEGEILIKDLIKMPHLLIAGSTGSGKSVCVNTLINSILYYRRPDEVKLILIDPKRVELILYDKLPHLITPVIKEAGEAIKALKWLVIHMEDRYKILEARQMRNIAEYNQFQETQKEEKMPYIVVIMDEFADLILLGKRELEESVIRLAAMARAVGIHLVLATQRPSADVITGLIKANFPSRIAFKVSSKMESRIILDENGAENLLGRGDMLFLSSEGGTTQRIQAPLMLDEEVRAVCNFFKERYTEQYWDEILAEEDVEGIDDIDNDNFDEDPMFQDAVKIILTERKTSASYLQRRLKIGYNRAARLVEMMEELGILSRTSGSKPREILVDEW